MAVVRARTFVQNLAESRHIPYIPPNGQTLNTGDQVEVEGILETQIKTMFEVFVLEEFLFDQATNRILVTYDIDGIGGGSGGGTLTPDDQNLTPLTTAFLNSQNTGILLSNAPAAGGTVHIFLNGNGPSTLGNGDKLKEFYFSSDGGVTARSILDIQVGDSLYYNALVAGFPLDSVDRISLVEAVLVP